LKTKNFFNKLSVKIAPQEVTRSFSFSFRPFIIPIWPLCKFVDLEQHCRWHTFWTVQW